MPSVWAITSPWGKESLSRVKGSKMKSASSIPTELAKIKMNFFVDISEITKEPMIRNRIGSKVKLVRNIEDIYVEVIGCKYSSEGRIPIFKISKSNLFISPFTIFGYLFLVKIYPVMVTIKNNGVYI